MVLRKWHKKKFQREEHLEMDEPWRGIHSEKRVSQKRKKYSSKNLRLEGISKKGQCEKGNFRRMSHEQGKLSIVLTKGNAYKRVEHKNKLEGGNLWVIQGGDSKKIPMFGHNPGPAICSVQN